MQSVKMRSCQNYLLFTVSLLIRQQQHTTGKSSLRSVHNGVSQPIVHRLLNMLFKLLLLAKLQFTVLNDTIWCSKTSLITTKFWFLCRVQPLEQNKSFMWLKSIHFKMSYYTGSCKRNLFKRPSFCVFSSFLFFFTNSVNHFTSLI